MKPLDFSIVDTIVIHHTASKRSAGYVHNIREWHLAKGWEDIGYHFVVTLDGIERGRPLFYKGAHCISHNHHTLGIAIAGNNLEPSEEWSLKQIMNAAKLIGEIQTVFPHIRRICGHRDMPNADTVCPGLDVRPLFRHLREGN